MREKYPISSYDNLCDGYGADGVNNTSYILGVTLGIGVSESNLSHKGSSVLEETNAFDLAEVDGPYIGQLNMNVVSSFCGPQGYIWGYDIANNLKNKRIFSELNLESIQYKEKTLPIYDGTFLLEALGKLFGTAQDKKFNIIPGAHVPFASKNIKVHGNGILYSSIGIGIPKDREKNACLLMEDIGLLETECDEEKRIIVENLAKSIIEVGINQKVEYKECLVLYKSREIKGNQTGCALVAAPYFTLARSAVPKNFLGELDFKKLLNISIEEWFNSLRK